MKVKIKKLNEKAVIPFKTYNEDFCYDVIATSEEQVAPNVWKYGIGLAFEIERGNEYLGKDIIQTTSWIDEDGNICETNVVKPHYFNFLNSTIKLSIDLRPRSSVWKTGMVLSNCEGTIDESYRGEISAVFYHVMPNMPRYKVGDKIAQLKLGFTMPIEFEEVDNLSETERGTGGYGSTGL